MVKIAARTDHQRAVTYFLCSHTLSEDEREGHWIGNCAPVLQLPSEPITPAQFRLALAGQSPAGPFVGDRLYLRATGKSRATELVFCPSKTISLAALSRDPELRASTRRAFRAAVLQTFRDQVEPLVRMHEFQRKMSTGMALGAYFVHTHSRRRDPHYHAHVLLFNTTFDPARRIWRRTDPRAIYATIRAISGAFHQHLFEALQKEGVPVEIRQIGTFSAPVIPALEKAAAKYSSARADIDRLLATQPPPLHVPIGRWRSRLNDRLRPAKTLPPPTEKEPGLEEETPIEVTSAPSPSPARPPTKTAQRRGRIGVIPDSIAAALPQGLDPQAAFLAGQAMRRNIARPPSQPEPSHGPAPPT